MENLFAVIVDHLMVDQKLKIKFYFPGVKIFIPQKKTFDVTR